MLKKLGRRVLLPLLFSFCCVFSGFLSVNTFASSAVLDLYQYYLMSNPLYFGAYTQGYFDSNGNSAGGGSALFTKSNLAIDNSGYYYVNNTSSLNNVNVINFECFSTVDTYPVVNDLYDYYLVATVCFDPVSSDLFVPDSIHISHKENNVIYNYNYSDLNVKVVNTSLLQGFQLTCKINFSSNVFYDRILFVDSDNGQFGKSACYNCFILPVLKNTSAEELQSIVTAINNQTNTLDGSIGQAADDVQQSIEDQYSGDPEEEFNIDDVMTEHTEKMGVLSFGSDVMVQFLDMFQSANVGTAELTLPGFNITVENVEYSVWPDYSFNFNQIDAWVPGLMSIIRVILPAFVWLKVLGYCITVFEKNFLSNNGG